MRTIFVRHSDTFIYGGFGEPRLLTNWAGATPESLSCLADQVSTSADGICWSLDRNTIRSMTA